MNRMILAIGALLVWGMGSDVLAAPAGASCATAILLFNDSDYTSDTTTTTNWMTSFGPLVSPSNDQLYTFTPARQPLGAITPLSATYQFAMYLIPSCADSGTEPSPIKATSTIGVPIDLSSGVTPGTQYYLAVTGIAAGGAGANGTLNFHTADYLPVRLQSFTIE